MSEHGAGSQVGPYLLVERLGRGGMGEVWLAEDPTGASGGAPRRVALKLLDPDRVDDPAARARFSREVQAARRVRGSTVAALLDADVGAPRPWLATAYVAGPTLADHVAAHGALGAVSLRSLGAALAEALVSIHAAGVVHRDLTPRNVVLGPDGPRVVDFGIARYDGADAVTETGARVGTPAWMAPERLTHDEVTPAGDVWSWGAVMAYAALGHPAVGGSGPDVVAYRILRGAVDLTGVPGWLEPWVAAALAVAPGDRPTPVELVAGMAGDLAPPTAIDVPVTGVDQPSTAANVATTAPDLAPTAPGLPPTAPGVPPTVPGFPPPPPPPPPSRRSRRRSHGRRARTPDAGHPSPPDEAVGRRGRAASPAARLLSGVVVLAVAVAVGWRADLLLVVLVTAVVMVAAVALRLSRLRLPEGSRPLLPTWAVALAGPVMLGTGLTVAFGAVLGLGLLVGFVALFVLLGGDLG